MRSRDLRTNEGPLTCCCFACVVRFCGAGPHFRRELSALSWRDLGLPCEVKVGCMCATQDVLRLFSYATWEACWWFRRPLVAVRPRQTAPRSPLAIGTKKSTAASGSASNASRRSFGTLWWVQIT
ncbi:unnamed protein product [Ixodes persulcatus]